jgi:hypothetical protein
MWSTSEAQRMPEIKRAVSAVNTITKMPNARLLAKLAINAIGKNAKTK